MAIDVTQAHDLLHRALENEAAVLAVYETAAACATDDELRNEWLGRRDAKAGIRRDLEDALRAVGIDAHVQTASRHVVRHLGQSLVTTIKMAFQSTSPALAELVAAQCIVQAESASRYHWALVGKVAKALPGGTATALRRLAHRLERDQEEHIERAEALLDQRSLVVLGLASPPVSRGADLIVLPLPAMRALRSPAPRGPLASAA